jgi:lipid-A-disaccharide synthase
MKYFLISGEASGDLHGSNLMKSIKAMDHEAEFQFFGGDKMAGVAGVQPISHNKDRAFMGIWEVITNLGRIKKALKLCKNSIKEFKPDAVIFVDYPGFNLKIAPFVKSLGIATHYFISPKIWAWNTKRVEKIKVNIDYMYSILPFEEEFYKKHDYQVDYVGNPLMDAIKDFEKTPSRHHDEKVLAIMPGSRKHEIRHMLPTMIAVGKRFSNLKMVLVAAPNIEDSFYKRLVSHLPEIHHGNPYDVLSEAHIALVTSGTATLEAGLFRVPQIVCYKFSLLSYFIGKMLIKVRFISLVNLILDRPLLQEYIQFDYTLYNLKDELNRLIDGPAREDQLRGYDELQEKIGEPGACNRAAGLIVSRVRG